VVEAITGRCWPLPDLSPRWAPPAAAGPPMVSWLHLQTPIHRRDRRHQAPFNRAQPSHPTPAVAGLPRREAMAWLRSLRCSSGGHYAAPIGWIDNAAMR